MKYLWIILFVFTASWGYTQQKEEILHKGEVIFTNGNSLAGLFSYDLNYEVVKLQSQHKMNVFNAVQIAEFTFKDAAYNVHRRFYTLPFSAQSDYKRKMFFELLVEGELSLFAREKKSWIEPTVPETMLSPLSRPEWRINYDFYAVDSLGNVYDLSKNTEKQLLDLMQPQKDNVKEYLKVEKPDYSDMLDMVRMFMYFNTLNIKSRYQDFGPEAVSSVDKLEVW